MLRVLPESAARFGAGLVGFAYRRETAPSLVPVQLKEVEE